MFLDILLSQVLLDDAHLERAKMNPNVTFVPTLCPQGSHMHDVISMQSGL